MRLSRSISQSCLPQKENYREAEQYYDKAIKLINQTYGDEHLYSATVIAGVAELYTLQNRYSEAEPLINKSQAIQEKLYGYENHLIAGACLTKASICQAKGNIASLKDLFKRPATLSKKQATPYRQQNSSKKLTPSARLNLIPIRLLPNSSIPRHKYAALARGW